MRSNNHDITLINPYPDSYCLETYPPMGIAYIAAVAEEDGKEVSIIDSHVMKWNALITALKTLKNNPEVVGIYTNLGNLITSKKIANYLRENGFEGKIIVGGPMSVAYEKVLEFADVSVIGEGEKTFLNLVNTFNNGGDLSKINGIAFKKNRNIVINKKREIMDIDKIPFPAWHLFPSLKKYKSLCRKRPDVPIFTSRGCPFKCIYCNKSVYGFTFRARSAENVVDEIEFLIDKFGAKELSIHDDVFTLIRSRAEQVCDLMIERGIDIQWKCDNGIRAESISKELLDKMHKAGCYLIALGAETGNQEVANKIQRAQSLDFVRKAAKLVKESDIVLKCFFQIGLPYDTAKTMRDTIEFAKELDPHIAQFAITTPLPETKLFELIEKEGKFLFDIWSNLSYYGGKPMYQIYDLDPEEVQKAFKRAYIEFYMRPNKLFSLFFGSRSIEEIKYSIETISYILKGMMRTNIKT